ncbi:MAG: AMP-binding protein [Fibrobacteres bacterium]|jgi:acyl-CoA synthetase (AMP-forming)/AMP-acid ligase II|nr:AMP-binding protein [Fibrobacterota bacterium]
MTASPLVELFSRHVAERPDQNAIEQGGRSITYGVLSNRMLQCARLLRDRKVGPGDRVVLYVPPSPDLYALLLAIWRIGAVAVFVDAWTSKQRLGQVVELVKPALFVGIPKAHLLRILNPSTCRIPSMLWWRDRGRIVVAESPADVEPASTALITFTTGSTGSPKGADRSHNFLLAQHQALSRTLGTNAGSTDLATLPIFALHNLASGATCRIASIDPAKPDAIDAPRFLEELRTADTSAGSPAVFLAAARSLAMPDPTIRARIHLGGAAVFPRTIQELSKAFPSARWSAVYGSTEAEPMALLEGRVLSEWSGSPDQGIPAGAFDPSLLVKIIHPADGPIVTETDTTLSEREVPRGKVGEILVSGAHVLESYWNDPVAMASNKVRTFERTWHRTGDAGRLDHQGNLYLLGRVSERIEWDGQTLHPFAIQQALLGIDGVSAGCALLHHGRIVLAVEPKPRLDRGALKHRILEFPWPFPFMLHFMDLPRDPRHRSKIDTASLRKRLTSDLQ